MFRFGPSTSSPRQDLQATVQVLSVAIAPRLPELTIVSLKRRAGQCESLCFEGVAELG